MGPLPGGMDDDVGHVLGDEGPAMRERPVRLGGGHAGAGWAEGPALDAPRRRPETQGDPGAWRAVDWLGAGGARPFRRVPPPGASGRRAFLIGLLGVAGIAAGGAVAWRAWRGRDWLAFLTGEPFEVRVTRKQEVTGRAGRLYVVEGTIRNLSGSPKGFFEVRVRLVDAGGRPLAERTAYAGLALEDSELKSLSRRALERRFSETVFGERMANARVEPRRTVPFQVVLLQPPPAARIAGVDVQVAGVKDVP